MKPIEYVRLSMTGHEPAPIYNRGQKFLGHLCSLMNYLCFTTEAWKKRCFPLKNALLFPLPTQYNVENQKKLQVVVFNTVWGVGGEVKQVKL